MFGTTVMKNIVLLTSTIKPKSDQPKLIVTNEKERLQQYKTALRHYVALLKKNIIDNIIYVDNSGYDLSELKKEFKSNQIEWVSYYDLDVPSGYHRGYGEFRLIDFAHNNSVILEAASNDDIIWKITGRYIIDNFETLIKKKPKHFDFYCNLNKNWMDMEVFGWNKRGYKEIVKGIYKKFNSKYPPELIFGKTVKDENNKELSIESKFYWPPVILGKRGTDGSSFQGKYTHIKIKVIMLYRTLINPFIVFLKDKTSSAENK